MVEVRAGMGSADPPVYLWRNDLPPLHHPRKMQAETEQSGPVTKEDVERLIGMSIGELPIYVQALTHGSVFRGETSAHLRSNERLEFLGDAVLDFLVAEVLFTRFPEHDEGFLTRVRARIVSGAALARYAEWIGLGDRILMSEDMERAGGRTNPTILANAFEAIIAAIYIDRGKKAARAFIKRVVLDELDLDRVAQQRDNFKSMLLEFAQARAWPQPVYEVMEEEGPPHERVFTVRVLVNGSAVGSGRARSKKLAEQQAAREALEHLQDAP